MAKLKNESVNENKSDKKTFDKIVKALPAPNLAGHPYITQFNTTPTMWHVC